MSTTLYFTSDSELLRAKHSYEFQEFLGLIEKGIYTRSSDGCWFLWKSFGYLPLTIDWLPPQLKVVDLVLSKTLNW